MPEPTAPDRWQLLFADLEAQVAAQDAAEADALVADLTRAELATTTLADRFRAAAGAEVVVQPAAGEPLRGAVGEAAPDCVVLRDGPRRHLVVLSGVVGVTGLGRRTVPARGRSAARLGLVLRELSRDRVRLLVRTVTDVLEGRIGRVGADHLDVEVERGDAPWRAPTARTVPFAALLCVSEGR